MLYISSFSLEYRKTLDLERLGSGTAGKDRRLCLELGRTSLSAGPAACSLYPTGQVSSQAELSFLVCNVGYRGLVNLWLKGSGW